MLLWFSFDNNLTYKIVNICYLSILEWLLSQLSPNFWFKTFVSSEKFKTNTHYFLTIALFDYSLFEFLEVRNRKHNNTGSV